MKVRIAIVSDVHYAGAEERARCTNNRYWQQVKNPIVRIAARAFHHFIWLRDHGGHNNLLDEFLAAAGQPDLVVANGDYSCNTGKAGVSDPASFASAKECLDKIRSRFAEKVRVTIGDHELGKTDLFSGRGSMTLASWPRVTQGLGIEPFWRVSFGKYVLLGITSSLVALPLYRLDVTAADAAGWDQLRQTHMENIRAAFAGLKPGERVILFSHDPSALPFLWREPVVRDNLTRLEQTLVGHLHTNVVIRLSRAFSWLPPVSFLGVGVRRITGGLREAKLWKTFHVRLCPALAGIQLLKDGGWLSIELDTDANTPAKFEFHPLKW
ncbi:MAG TPA: metallophosphoesterase [Verrucomicrobiae bacterium]|nr:metallophosphoesterase [Verrucomicrobiae bacterium]